MKGNILEDYLDYDEFGEYLNSVTNLSENYEITVDKYIPEIYASDPDNAYPAECEFEIEYCGNESKEKYEVYFVNLKDFMSEFGMESFPIEGKFILTNFLKDGCEAIFKFEFLQKMTLEISYRCKLLSFELF